MMKKSLWKSTLAMTACVAVLVGTTACGGGHQRGGLPTGPKEVVVSTVEVRDVELSNSYPAVVKGANDAQIRPMVSGFITRVAVEEGQRVRRGQVLFTLDDATYKAALGQAQAAVGAARAQLATAQLNYDNAVQLKNKNVVSETNLSTQANVLAVAKAQLAQAEAAVVAARENLRFCSVTSPVDGVVGTINYRVGDLVGPSVSTALTQVADAGEVYVYFSLSERQMAELSTDGRSVAEIIANFPAVKFRQVDGTFYAQEGKVRAISGVVDAHTGAISFRADFANLKGTLRSGGTGEIVVPYTMKQTIVVPQAAVTQVLGKKFVYKVDDKNIAHAVEIMVSPVSDGQYYVVTGGLQAGDRIIVEGASAVKDSAEVIPQTPEQSAQAQADMKDFKKVMDKAMKMRG